MSTVRHVPISEYKPSRADYAVYDLGRALGDLWRVCQTDLAEVRKSGPRIHVLMGELCRIDALINPRDVP